MNLFEKSEISGLKVKNHFVRSATYEGNADENGYPGEACLKIYKDLAAGGVGTIITSYSRISESDFPAAKQLSISRDDTIEHYAEMIKAAHDGDCKIIMQIVHGSSSAQADLDKAVVLGPSAVKHPRSGITPKEMTQEDIDNVVRLFAEAAARVEKAGFDGVQIHSAHGFLLSQFISPIFNKRSDEYGGSASNRNRLNLEVLAAVKKAVSDDFPVWIKINSTDGEEGGLTLDDFLIMGKELADAGIDAIEISGGDWGSRKPDEHAYYKEAAIKLGEMTDTPIILTGGIRNIEVISKLADESKIKFFGLSRPLMRFPDFVNRMRQEYENLN